VGRLDLIVGEERAASAPRASNAAQRAMMPYLRVFYRCANAYQRVYRNADGSAYVARCPSCGKSTTFRVGPGGTGERFFELSCS
jgi:hypothetical protein